MSAERLAGVYVIEALNSLNGYGTVNQIVDKVVELQKVPRAEVQELIMDTIKAGIKYGYLLERVVGEGDGLSLESVVSETGHRRRGSRRRSRRLSKSRSRSRSKRRSGSRRSSRRSRSGSR